LNQNAGMKSRAERPTITDFRQNEEVAKVNLDHSTFQQFARNEKLALRQNPAGRPFLGRFPESHKFGPSGRHALSFEQ